MKKNWLKNFSKLLLGLSLASVCFFVTGCGDALGGKAIKEIEDAINNGEISEEEGDSLREEYSGGLELDGIKVLRRPSEYDYENNVVEEGKDYYKKFSEDIFYNLYRSYGILNENYASRSEAPGVNIFEALYNIKVNDGTTYLKDIYSETSENHDNLKYYYDSIRYQITKEEKFDSSSEIAIFGSTYIDFFDFSK